MLFQAEGLLGAFGTKRAISSVPPGPGLSHTEKTVMTKPNSEWWHTNTGLCGLPAQEDLEGMARHHEWLSRVFTFPGIDASTKLMLLLAP